MVYSRDGRCADCVEVGDTPDWSDSGRRYCWLHWYERERHRKRRNQVVSRARRAGKPIPPPEPYTPVPRAQLGAVYVNGNERHLVRMALHDLERAESRVRAAMEGTDGYAVGLAAEDLIDANRHLRETLDAVLAL